MSILLKMWLIFCQTTTVLVALFFVISSLKPFWIEVLLKNSIDQRTSKVVEKTNDDLITLSDNNNIIDGFNSLRSAASLAMPSVVHIYTTQKKTQNSNNIFLNDPFFRKFFNDNFNLKNPNSQPKTGLGSGVIVSKNGNIITNHHVIEGAEKIEIALSDGRKATAIVIGNDPDTDLAVLQIKLKNLNKITFGDSTSAFVGDTVLAIGNPFGVGQTATQGIISALGRNKLNINTFENFIQTDAAINPGNSGGALVNSKGELIGINTAIYSQSGGNVGIGFAIPSSTVEFVLNSILTNGKVTRGFLGVQPTSISNYIAQSLNLPNSNGAYISKLITDGPADKAGLLPGDIVLKIDKNTIIDKEDLLETIAKIRPGTNISVEILRKGEKLLIPTEIGERPK